MPSTASGWATWTPVVLLATSMAATLAFQRLGQRRKRKTLWGAPTLHWSATASRKLEAVLGTHVCKQKDGGVGASEAAEVVEAPRRLHVILDFDRTITSHTASECHSLFMNEAVVGPDMADKVTRLLDFENMDPALVGKPFEFWWEHCHDLFVEGGLTREQMLRLVDVADPPMSLRDGVAKLLRRLHELGIPVTVVSAGIQQIIEHRLSASGLLLPNMRVIANELFFDAAGACVGYSKPPVHSHNKHLTYDKLQDWFDGGLPTGEERVLLVLGDSCGDVKAGAEVPSKAQLHVGFFDDSNPWASFCAFEAAYDVLLPKEEGYRWLLRALEGMVPS